MDLPSVQVMRTVYGFDGLGGWKRPAKTWCLIGLLEAGREVKLVMDDMRHHVEL